MAGLWSWVYLLWNDVERYITRQRSCRRGHGDVAGGRTCWDCGLDKGVGYNREACRNSVERYAGGSGEPLAENAAGLADFACGADERDEGAEAHIQTVDRAEAISTALSGHAVQNAVCSLEQTVAHVETIRAIKLV